MENITAIDLLTPTLSIIGQLLSWNVITFLIMSMVGLFVAREIMRTLFESIGIPTPTSGSSPQSARYQEDRND